MPQFIENILIGVRLWVTGIIDEKSFVISFHINELHNTKEDKSNKVISISNESTNIEYPSAKCVYDEFEGTVDSKLVSNVGNISLSIESTIPIVNKTQDSSVSFTIDSNKMYMFGERTNLTIIFNTPSDNTIVNEYLFLFISGNTATTLSVPNTVVWMKTPDIQTNKKYIVSIEDNLGVIGEWSNE